MPLKEGDRIRIVSRDVTDEDRKTFRYYKHMAGLVGTVQNIYGKDEIAVKVDPDALIDPSKMVHTEATRRMRNKFVENASEEAKSQLTAEQMKFNVNYMLLVREADLEKI